MKKEPLKKKMFWLQPKNIKKVEAAAKKEKKSGSKFIDDFISSLK